jgi:hypothetical protein
MAFIAALTNQLAQYSASAAEAVIQAAMETAATAALEAAVFSTTAGSALRPPGILNGVTPITAAAASADDLAMVTDLGALAGAIADAGGGANILWFANPRQATVVRLRAPTFDVVPTAALPARTVVAVEVGGVATGYLGARKFRLQIPRPCTWRAPRQPTSACQDHRTLSAHRPGLYGRPTRWLCA